MEIKENYCGYSFGCFVFEACTRYSRISSTAFRLIPDIDLSVEVSGKKFLAIKSTARKSLSIKSLSVPAEATKSRAIHSHNSKWTNGPSGPTKKCMAGEFITDCLRTQGLFVAKLYLYIAIFSSNRSKA